VIILEEHEEREGVLGPETVAGECPVTKVEKHTKMVAGRMLRREESAIELGDFNRDERQGRSVIKRTDEEIEPIQFFTAKGAKSAKGRGMDC
jgi:hypothetical protein